MGEKSTLAMGWDRRILVVAILAGVAMRIWSCFAAFGIYWSGDEVEYVNMAWLIVHGYGWPSLQMRSPFYPLLLTLPIRIAAAFQVQGGGVMLMTRLFGLVFSVALVFSVYFLAKMMYSERVAVYAAILMCFSAPMIIWTPRVMSDLPAASFAFMSFTAFIYSLRRKSLLTMVVAGCLLGFAFLTRYNYVIFLLPLMLYLLLQKQWRPTGGMVLGFTLVFLLGGMLDSIYWGQFLHSLIVYYKWVLASGLHVQPLDVSYYVRNIGWYVTPVSLVLSIIGLKKNKETLLLLGLLGTFLVAISLTANYDLRYGLILVPLLLVLAGNGLSELGRYLGRFSSRFPSTRTIVKVVPALLLLAVIGISLVQAVNGPYVYNGDAAQAALFLSAQPDVKGVITVGFADNMGEYIFLQKSVPLLEYTTQNLSILEGFCASANYVIVIEQKYFQINPAANTTMLGFGFVRIKSFGDAYVLKKA